MPPDTGGKNLGTLKRGATARSHVCHGTTKELRSSTETAY